MGYLLLKAGLTGIIVVAISELSKRSSVLAAILASLPLSSVLAFVWLYADTKDVEAVRQLSYGIFWMVLPSLAFFLILPFLLRAGVKFYPALLVSSLSLAILYAGYVRVLGYFEIQL